MSRNYYSEINLHLTWHTKRSMPLLTPTIEPVAHRLLKERVIKTPGVYLHEIGGTETHVHLAVTIPPTLTISDWIGELKGGSSHDVNQQMGMRSKALQWQPGYGVVSFGAKDTGVGHGVHSQPARSPPPRHSIGAPGADYGRQALIRC
jgi:putative transposase